MREVFRPTTHLHFAFISHYFAFRIPRSRFTIPVAHYLVKSELFYRGVRHRVLALVGWVANHGAVINFPNDPRSYRRKYEQPSYCNHPVGLATIGIKAMNSRSV